MKTILRVTKENELLKDDVKRLRTELEEAKRPVDGFHDDILMSSVIDSLLHQAQSLSARILDKDK